MVAGEASGDQLGGHLMAALQARRPGLRFSGIGGPRMIAQGLESLYSIEQLSVRGYVEVLRRYRSIAAMRRELVQRLIEERPALFIGIDSSDFNLDIERRLKDAGIPSVHYVSPAIWAWRGWRLQRIARSVTHLLALFPFEPALYAGTRVGVTYVGHPLADMIPAELDKSQARAQLRLPPGRPIVAVLPGSRKSEVDYMGDVFVRAALRLRQAVPEAHFVCPTATRETRAQLEAVWYRHASDPLPVTLLFGHSHEALAAADVALVASGTATLEAALIKTPMVIAYRQAPVTWALMRRMSYVPHIGLPNILAGEGFVPEFVQARATAEALAGALEALLADGDAQRRQIERFRAIHATLRQNTAQKAADAVLRVLETAGA